METSTALLVTTIIMAMGAITFSALTMAFERSYHRKSVRPFCNIHQNVTNTGMCISIENAGMGPMLIQSILILSNNDSIQTGIPLTEEEFSLLDCEVFVQGTKVYALAAHCRLNVLQTSAGISGNEATKLLRNRLKGCCLYIKYADIYDHIYEAKAELIL